jgi:hypothetical protein
MPTVVFRDPFASADGSVRTVEEKTGDQVQETKAIGSVTALAKFRYQDSQRFLDRSTERKKVESFKPLLRIDIDRDL